MPGKSLAAFSACPIMMSASYLLSVSRINNRISAAPVDISTEMPSIIHDTIVPKLFTDIRQRPSNQALE